ncbi:MAG: hypothetical protein QXU74_02470 [Candidatus Aenigmatarchaeota archaeon]
MPICEENVNKLVKNFNMYVDVFYKSERDRGFPKSSFYFHKRVIEIIRKNGHEKIFKDNKLFDYFSEILYATLATWGMDRMGKRGPRLANFETFKKSLRDVWPKIEELNLRYSLEKIEENELETVKENLIKLFNSLKNKIMKTEQQLVGISKTLHHLLPDLVPPIDRKYTLNFFYSSQNSTSKDEDKKFGEIFEYFYKICKRIGLSSKNLKREWDTSIPKLIDNAIIGFERGGVEK